MSMDPEDTRTPECPACGFPVHDYEPGVSSKKVDGLLFHPDCVPCEGCGEAKRECTCREEEVVMDTIPGTDIWVREDGLPVVEQPRIK